MPPVRYYEGASRASRYIRELAKQYGVDVGFVPASDLRQYAGYFLPPNVIRIVTGVPAKNLVMTFFHELGHFHCFNENLWTKYHRDATKPNLNCEIYVARWAKREYQKARLDKRFGEYEDGYLGNENQLP